MGTTLVDACTGVRRANEAARDEGQVSDTEINAVIRIGSFARPLPGDKTKTIEVTAALVELALEFDPRLLDQFPIVETAFGNIPVPYLLRCTFLESTAKDAADPTKTKAKSLLRAAATLEQRLRLVEQFFELRRQVIWQGLRDAEWGAADLLGSYLIANLAKAQEERERYLYPNGVPRVSSEDFKELRAAVKRIAARRRSVDLDAIKREQNVVECLALGLMINAVAGSINRLDFTMDAQAWAELASAMQMSQEARTHTVEALAKYMETVRTEAEKHPVVLLLDHPEVENVSFNLFAKAVNDALRKCEKAVEKLMQGGVNQETFGTARRYQDLSFTGMAAQIANSSRVSVWKLPFFMERALLVQPVRQANVVRRMMEYAAEVEGQGAIRMNLAFMGTDTAMMVAPAAGYIGVALALTWAIISLGRSIHEYTQLSDLYEASIDPAVQLLGDEHGPASKLWVVLDLFGLIV